jgi:predicted RNase H-like HicB family nuclease
MKRASASAAERLAFPLTFLLKREEGLWASLCVETGVASCGDSQDEAREKLQGAVAGYYAFLRGKGREEQFLRPMSPAEVEDFRTDPPGEVTVEHYTMLVTLAEAHERDVTCSSRGTEFVRSVVPNATSYPTHAAA